MLGVRVHMLTLVVVARFQPASLPMNWVIISDCCMRTDTLLRVKSPTVMREPLSNMAVRTRLWEVRPEISQMRAT